MVKITQQSRINGRKNINLLEEDLTRKRLFIKKQWKEILQREELFFAQQIGKYFKSESEKRFFKILSYERDSPYCDCGVFDINFFDLKDRIEHKDKSTTCYNVFGHSFEIIEISKEVYYNILKNKKEDGIPPTNELAGILPKII